MNQADLSLINALSHLTPMVLGHFDPIEKQKFLDQAQEAILDGADANMVWTNSAIKQHILISAVQSIHVELVRMLVENGSHVENEQGADLALAMALRYASARLSRAENIKEMHGVNNITKAKYDLDQQVAFEILQEIAKKSGNRCSEDALKYFLKECSFYPKASQKILDVLAKKNVDMGCLLQNSEDLETLKTKWPKLADHLLWTQAQRDKEDIHAHIEARQDVADGTLSAMGRKF